MKEDEAKQLGIAFAAIIRLFALIIGSWLFAWGMNWGTATIWGFVLLAMYVPGIFRNGR